jgi:hypothetical protein
VLPDKRRLLISSVSVIALSVSLSIVGAMAPSAARADDTTEQKIEALQKQIQAQQKQMNEQQQQLEMLKAQAQMAQTQADKAKVAAQAAQAQATASAAPTANGFLNHGLLYKSANVNLTLGGFIEAAGIYRDHNEEADVGSSFKLGNANGIPLPFSANYYGSEYRGTARQSRLSLLAQGDDNLQSYAAYFELDFLGAGASSNSVESNSYTPRIRHIYATYDDPADGWHVLGGQTWSLLTMNRQGIIPRTEVTPATIEAQYVTGFTWDRAPQIRVVKDFDKKLWIGVSAETPQASIYNGGGYNTVAATAASAPALGNVTFNNAGGSLLNSGSNYSLDQAPDFVAKVAYDPGWGHYEVFGVARDFHDRANPAAGRPGSHDTLAGGGGASALLPVIDRKLDFQVSFLDGVGIGRYGSAQFSDAVVNANNDELTPIPEFIGLAGLVGHPTSSLDVYGYGGYEGEQKTAVTTVAGKFYGLGNPNYTNTGCNIENSALSCVANASSEWQATIGGWWKFYQGKAGMMEIGASEAYIHVNTFSGVGGAPHANENIVMTSFRYYPF